MTKKGFSLVVFSSICTDTEKKITHDFVEAPSRAALVIEGEKSFFLDLKKSAPSLDFYPHKKKNNVLPIIIIFCPLLSVLI